MSETGKPERRLHFSLRKLLLWTLIVALAFGIFSPLELEADGRFFLFGWILVVAVVRGAFGRFVGARLPSQ